MLHVGNDYDFMLPNGTYKSNLGRGSQRYEKCFRMKHALEQI